MGRSEEEKKAASFILNLVDQPLPLTAFRQDRDTKYLMSVATRREEECKMPVAGAVVVPTSKEREEALSESLDALEGVSVQGIGDKGIALILEAESVGSIEKMSEAIAGWGDVLDFQLAYLNWEDA